MTRPKQDYIYGLNNSKTLNICLKSGIPTLELIHHQKQGTTLFSLVVSGRYPKLSCNLIGYSSGRYFTMSLVTVRKDFFLQFVNKTHYDANDFYHPNATDNCKKQRICGRYTGKIVTM